jgi:RNA polymerase sigma-70 factor (ECF subfamily)
VTTRPDFAEFYSASFGQITAQLHAFIGDHAEAQDIVQEAFCRAYARWSSVGMYDDPLSWVRRVAWNMAVSRWRRARLLRVWRHDLLAGPVPGPSAASVDLTRALAQLPANQRQAVVFISRSMAVAPVFRIRSPFSTPSPGTNATGPVTSSSPAMVSSSHPRVEVGEGRGASEGVRPSGVDAAGLGLAGGAGGSTADAADGEDTTSETTTVTRATRHIARH